MAITGRTNAVANIVSSSSYSRTNGKLVKEPVCENCKWENSSYECTHPKSGTAKFSSLEMHECFEKGNYKSEGQKNYDKRNSLK